LTRAKSQDSIPVIVFFCKWITHKYELAVKIRYNNNQLWYLFESAERFGTRVVLNIENIPKVTVNKHISFNK
jgi:phenolic acid decarboxylase